MGLLGPLNYCIRPKWCHFSSYSHAIKTVFLLEYDIQKSYTIVTVFLLRISFLKGESSSLLMFSLSLYNTPRQITSQKIFHISADTSKSSWTIMALKQRSLAYQKICLFLLVSCPLGGGGKGVYTKS